MSRYITLNELGFSSSERLRYFQLFGRLCLMPKKVIVPAKDSQYKREYLLNAYTIEQAKEALDYYSNIFNKTKNFIYKPPIAICKILIDKMTRYSKDNQCN